VYLLISVPAYSGSSCSEFSTVNRPVPGKATRVGLGVAASIDERARLRRAVEVVAARLVRVDFMVEESIVLVVVGGRRGWGVDLVVEAASEGC
jgi:hypothetical protein